MPQTRRKSLDPPPLYIVSPEEIEKGEFTVAARNEPLKINISIATDRINFLERELEIRIRKLEAAGAVFQQIFKLYRVEQTRNESLLKTLTEIEEKLRP